MGCFMCGRRPEALTQVREQLLHLHLQMIVSSSILKHIPVMTSMHIPMSVMMSVLMAALAVSVLMTMLVIVSVLVSTVIMSLLLVRMISSFATSCT